MQSFIAKQEVFHKTPKRPPYFYLKPSKETLSETFYQRWGKPSRWKGFDKMLLTNPRLVTNPKWLSFDWDGRFKQPLKIIALPEFFADMVSLVHLPHRSIASGIMGRSKHRMRCCSSLFTLLCCRAVRCYFTMFWIYS